MAKRKAAKMKGRGFLKDFGVGFLKGVTGGIVDLDPSKGKAINKFLPGGKEGFLARVGLKPSDVIGYLGPEGKAISVGLKSTGNGKRGGCGSGYPNSSSIGVVKLK